MSGHTEVPFLSPLSTTVTKAKANISAIEVKLYLIERSGMQHTVKKNERKTPGKTSFQKTWHHMQHYDLEHWFVQCYLLRILVEL